MDEDVSKSPKKALLIMLTYAHFSCSSSTSCLGQQTCRTPMGGKTRPEFQGGPAGRAIPTGNLSGKAGNGAPASSLCPQNLLPCRLLSRTRFTGCFFCSIVPCRPPRIPSSLLSTQNAVNCSPNSISSFLQEPIAKMWSLQWKTSKLLPFIIYLSIQLIAAVKGHKNNICLSLPQFQFTAFLCITLNRTRLVKKSKDLFF